MVDDFSKTETFSLRELFSLLATLIAIWLLLGACIAAPIVATRMFNPWVGVLASLGSFCVWIWFGPRPMPGFGAGIICLGGLAAILGTMLVCLFLAIRSVFG